MTDEVSVTQADRDAAAALIIAAPVVDNPDIILHGGVDSGGFVQAFARHRIASEQSRVGEGDTDALRRAAQALVNQASDTYRKGNGQIGSIEADDGEKCWIVHDDDMVELRTALAGLRTSQPTPAEELADEQHPRETAAEMVARLSDMLGPDTDFDNYTFSIKRGNLRRLLAALPSEAEVGARFEARPVADKPWVWEVWDISHEADCNHFPVGRVDSHGASDDLHEQYARKIAATLSEDIDSHLKEPDQ